MRKPDVVLADDAIERLAESLHDRVLVVMDVNTEEAAGARVLAELRAAAVDAEPLLLEQRSGLQATPAVVDRVHRRLLDLGRLPVAVGAGVITDIVRHAAHLRDAEFVSVPTAASMDGYASSVAALQLDGLKVTYPSRAPRAIFADPRVAAGAPSELTRSGIGDLLAKATARVDWLAAHLLYGEPFSDQVAGRVLGPLEFTVANVRRVLGGSVDAVTGLLSGLIESGIAMAMAGSSRPASGFEHHASHFWDLLAAQGRRPHGSHGLQVGYATRFAMRLQRFAFGGAISSLKAPVAPANPLDARARQWLGEPSPEIAAAVTEKQAFAAHLQAWPHRASDWDAVQDAIAPALELFGGVERALTEAMIPAEPGYLAIDEPTLRATCRYASRLRARYTVVDFLEGQGVLEDAIEVALRPGR